MKVKWIEFENVETGLVIQRIHFFDDVTLLVGLSGVGKSQILNAIGYSLKLATRNDVVLRPYDVSMCLLIDDVEYVWSYRIEKDSHDLLLLENQNQYCFVNETLTKNGETVFKRNKEDLHIEGFEKLPQPKKEESILSQYSEDEKFRKIILEMKKLYSVEMELAIRGGINKAFFNEMKSQVTIIKEGNPDVSFKMFSHLPPLLKLYIVKKYYKTLYKDIFDAVKELFEEIEDIDVVEDKRRELYLVSIQVYGKQILQNDISNGMLKTIYYIVELYTMSENSLALIDEFENGLGVNCIDTLADILLNDRSDLQFIITSHHPKIINEIDMNNWKIIDRNNKIITNSDADSYGIGNSQHDAYFNLINRWEYEKKI